MRLAPLVMRLTAFTPLSLLVTALSWETRRQISHLTCRQTTLLCNFSITHERCVETVYMQCAVHKSSPPLSIFRVTLNILNPPAPPPLPWAILPSQGLPLAWATLARQATSCCRLLQHCNVKPYASGLRKQC